MEKLCTNKNHSYKQTQYRQFKMFFVKFVKIYPEMTSQTFFGKKHGFGWLYMDFFLHFPILLTDDYFVWSSVGVEGVLEGETTVSEEIG